MNKKTLLLAMLPILMLAMSVPVFAQTYTIPSKDHYIIESIGDPETVDPAWAYDTASAGLIFQVYETLIDFDRERVDVVRDLLCTDHYEGPPARAYLGTTTDYPVVKTHYFEVRTGVYFHSGNLMTPADAEYSIEHIMVQDRAGGPEWMIFEPLLAVYHNHHLGDLTNPAEAAEVGHILDDTVESNSTHVWFNFVWDYPEIVFLQIWAQSWCSILDYTFMSDHGDWPGAGVAFADRWGTYTEWVAYDNPGTAPIDVAGNLMSGTGPFKLDYWIHGVEWSIIKNDDYWQGWPAPGSSGHLERLTEKVVYEWSTRLADFKAGTADSVYVPRAYISAVEGEPGIRGIKDLPTLSVDAMFFNFNITEPSLYIGSGTLDGNGIPADFFDDDRIRKAFAYAFEYDTYLHEVFLDEAKQPPSPHVEGLSYAEYVWYGGTLPNGTVLAPIDKYYFNTTEIVNNFQAASADPTSPAYGVWTKGFKMTITYNAGNIPRLTAASMLEANIEAAFADNGGGPVDISLLAVTWSTYLGELWWYPTSRTIMPIYIIGWLADYPDPHNFCMPFQHSEGDFAYPSSYHNEYLDDLIEAAAVEGDTDNQRPAMYHEIAQIYYDDCPSVIVSQATGRRWEQEWVQGWYYNSIYPMTYYYPVWKGVNAATESEATAVTYDEVDIYDAAVLSSHWYDPPIVGLLGYDPIADIYPSLQYTPSNLGTHVGDGTGAVSIGYVDINDAGYMNGHWGEHNP